jgi:predicted site-specific integrase-resolvase
MFLSNRKLRILQATLLLSVSPRTVQRYLDHGKLESSWTPGGYHRVLVTSLMHICKLAAD